MYKYIDSIKFLYTEKLIFYANTWQENFLSVMNDHKIEMHYFIN